MSTSLHYIERFTTDRQAEIPLGYVDMTELGWCTAIVLTMQAAGFDVRLMEGSAYGYRIPNAYDGQEYEDLYSFPLIEVPAGPNEDAGVLIDMLGNQGLADIAQNAACDMDWEYVDNGHLHVTSRPLVRPNYADPDEQSYFDNVYRQLAHHLASMIAEELSQAAASAPANNARTPRL